jgi:hypothetical protein
MSEQSAGVVGLFLLAGLFLFLWWWFGLKTILTVLGIFLCVLVAVGLFAKARK